MSELQDAFLFDYLGFQHAAQPIVRALDEGDLQPLIRRTTQIRREIGASETWILQDRGTELSSLERLQYKGVTADTIAQWGGPGVLQGHDLLLLLSSFLSPAISLGYDQPLLAHALEQMGWGDTEIDLIRQG